MNDYIDRMNWANDPRNCERAKPPTFVECTPDGEEIVHELPWKWAVCDVCEGKGTHVNPSIDCGGLSREDFNDDPDFAYAYGAGLYDVPCNKCGGRTTIPVIDESRIDPELLKKYQAHLKEEAEYVALCRSEFIHGC